VLLPRKNRRAERDEGANDDGAFQHDTRTRWPSPILGVDCVTTQTMIARRAAWDYDCSTMAPAGACSVARAHVCRAPQ
jgi:hypothetical protein